MTDHSSRDYERARNLSVEMTRWASVTGSDGEAEFAPRLRALMAELPYFAANPDHLFSFDTHGTPPRQNLCALVRGTGSRTIVLAGHYDTVSIANYGQLADLATEPEELTETLILELTARKGRTEAEERTLQDLTSGDFLPGRGLLDMKSGLAAGIVALERFASLDERVGNLLFVATPDEENRSRGMIALRDRLPEIAKKLGLEIVGGINLDSTSDEGDGSEGRAVYLGSVGKFSPFAFVVGRPTHAGYPFDGISAQRIGAEIVRAVDTVPELADEAFGERTPPPVCLKARDLRDGYDVTTPDRVWLSFNWLTHRRAAAELLADFRAVVAGALAAALDAEDGHAARHRGTEKRRTDGVVLTYADLLDRVRERGGEAALGRLERLDAEVSGGGDPLKASRKIVAAAATEAGIEGPAVIVGFASLHYPLVHLDRNGEAGQRMRERLAAVTAEVAARHGTGIKFKQIFAGISDMSFLGHRPTTDETGLIAANTPSAAFTDRAPEGLLAFPTVNIGPWGRDYHQKWERVHAPYTFGVLPDLVFEAAVACLKP